MNPLKKLTIYLFLIGFLLTLTARAKAQSDDFVEPDVAATHYVSLGGSDSNPGTQARPWRTIQKAANAAPSGAIIQVEAGNYGENVNISRGSLTFRANGRVITRSVWIPASNVNLFGFEITGASEHGLNISGKNVLAERNVVHWNSLNNSSNGRCNSTSGGSWQSGIKLSVGAENVTIRYNRSFNNCGEGIAVTRGVSAVVENNIVYDNFSVNIYVDNSNGIIVRNNLVTCSDVNLRDGNRAKGISIAAEYYSGWGNQLRDVTVWQNTIADCEYGVLLGEPFDGGQVSNIQIDSNSIVSGTRRSISVLTSRNQNVIVQNNLIFNPIYVSNASGVTLRNNQAVNSSHVIAGRTGETNVRLNYFDGSNKFVTTNIYGDYFILVPSQWSGVVTPVKSGFGFWPAQRSYSRVTGSRMVEDYMLTWAGGVVIQSSQPIVTVTRPHLGSQIASYIGSGMGNAVQYVPMLFKGAFGGGYNAALYVQNTTSASANLTIQFTNSNGAVVYTKTDAIGPNASKGYWLPAESGLPNGFAGGARVVASQPILALGRPHIGAEVMTYNGVSAGSTTAWLPMFFKNGFGSYNTALYIQNVSGSNANLTIQYLNLNGTVVCTDNDTLAANASRGYWSLSVTCDAGSLPSGFVGGVKVISTQNILAVGRVHLGSQITTYNGFVGGATTAYVPMLFRNAFANGSYKAALYLQNVGGATANVTIEYLDGSGVVAATQNMALNAGAMSSIWLPSVPGLPDGFAGGARITASQPVIAVGRPHLGVEITAYNGAPGGSVGAYLPMLFKNAFGSYQSAFYIQNVTGNAASVNISFYDSTGVLSCAKNITLAPHATQGFWMPAVSCAP